MNLDLYSNSAYVTVEGDPKTKTILFLHTAISTHTAPVKAPAISAFTGMEFLSVHGDWTSDTVFANGITVETHGLVKMSKTISGVRV